tara:strand:- start:107 stop:673 length:567 start_codon:yes stop_codon:yes gene_type:complete
MILGIDPANDGAAVLLQDGEVSHVWSWKYMRRKESIFKLHHTYIEQGVISQDVIEVRDGGQIASMIAARLRGLGSCSVGIEDAYVSKINPRSGLRVARFGGSLIGGLSAIQGKDLASVTWITASNWRHQLLGLSPFTKREQCKIASLSLIPKLLPSINPHLDAHGQLDHITDALGVALWLQMKQLEQQ